MKRLALLALLLAASCSGLSPEARVRDRLERAGVKPELAECMAHKLVRKLDSSELERLAKATKRAPGDAGKMNIDDLAGRLQAMGDPHIVSVVTRTGLGCAIAG